MYNNDETWLIYSMFSLQAVLNVGFDECRIIRALRCYFKLHKGFKNIEELFAVVIDSQKQDPEVSGNNNNISCLIIQLRFTYIYFYFYFSLSSKSEKRKRSPYRNQSM